MPIFIHAAESAPLLAAGSFTDSLVSFAPMLLMLAVVYFVLLRPMSQEEKSRKDRLGDLKKGDKIVLSGGILGRISRLEENVAVVEISDKVKVRVLRKDIVDTETHAIEKAKESAGGGGLFGAALAPKADGEAKDSKSEDGSDKDKK